MVMVTILYFYGLLIGLACLVLSCVMLIYAYKQRPKSNLNKLNAWAQLILWTILVGVYCIDNRPTNEFLTVSIIMIFGVYCALNAYTIFQHESRIDEG